MSAGEQNRSPAIAVLSAGRSARTAEDWAVDLRALGELDAEAVVVPVTGEDLARDVERLPDRFHAVLLVQTDPGQASEAGEHAGERGLRLVVSDHDGAAVAMCTAVLDHLRVIARPLDRAKVAIAGAANLPSLTPLLMIAGVYDLLTWNDSDAPAFPWEQTIRDADVVVDLRPGPAAAAQTTRIAADRPEGAVLRPSDVEWDRHVVAGVLRVALACPPGSMHVSLGMLRACAAAIVAAAARPGRLRAASSEITSVVEAAVRRSIDPRLAALGVAEG